MSFWLGVFAGLTVWKALMTLGAVALQGRTVTYGNSHILAEFAQLVLFGVIAWHLATFGGGA